MTDDTVSCVVAPQLKFFMPFSLDLIPWLKSRKKLQRFGIIGSVRLIKKTKTLGKKKRFSEARKVIPSGRPDLFTLRNFYRDAK